MAVNEIFAVPFVNIKNMPCNIKLIVKMFFIVTNYLARLFTVPKNYVIGEHECRKCVDRQL